MLCHVLTQCSKTALLLAKREFYLRIEHFKAAKVAALK